MIFPRFFFRSWIFISIFASEDRTRGKRREFNLARNTTKSGTNMEVIEDGFRVLVSKLREVHINNKLKTFIWRGMTIQYRKYDAFQLVFVRFIVEDQRGRKTTLRVKDYLRERGGVNWRGLASAVLSLT